MQSFQYTHSIWFKISIIFTLLISPGLLACKNSYPDLIESDEVKVVLKKVNFDISRISEQGLMGPQNGLRSVSYEFCIPANAQSLAEIWAIDPTLKHSRSPGRIRCTSNQYLVIGNTHKPNWRQILTQLSKLDYVQRIDEFFGE